MATTEHCKCDRAQVYMQMLSHWCSGMQVIPTAQVSAIIKPSSATGLLLHSNRESHVISQRRNHQLKWVITIETTWRSTFLLTAIYSAAMLRQWNTWTKRQNEQLKQEQMKSPSPSQRSIQQTHWAQPPGRPGGRRPCSSQGPPFSLQHPNIYVFSSIVSWKKMEYFNPCMMCVTANINLSQFYVFFMSREIYHSLSHFITLMWQKKNQGSLVSVDFYYNFTTISLINPFSWTYLELNSDFMLDTLCFCRTSLP